MKKRICMGILAVVFLIGIPASGYSALVYDTTGWITATTPGLNFDFVADISPYTYSATITDVSGSLSDRGTPFFGLDFLYLNIITGSGENTKIIPTIVDPAQGFSTISFEVDPGQIVHAMVFGQVDPDTIFNTGAFRLEVNSVPIPTSLALLGSGILAILSFRRKRRS